MNRRLLLTFALATGIAVSAQYYAQPLLARIGGAFHVSSGTAALVVTLGQVGYAAGLVLIVPLGDVLERRRLIVSVLIIAAVGLALAAISPGVGVLLAAALCFGAGSVVAQILVPFAATLATPSQRGTVVGTVMTGLLVGILLSRTFSGLVAQALGWRAVYWIGAALLLLLAFALSRELLVVPQAERISYGRLLRSVWVLVHEEPVLRQRMLFAALVFASFNVLWTPLAFLLASPNYGFSVGVIGLFGLLGAAGATAASFAGRIADRGHNIAATGIWMTAILAGFGLLALGAHNLAWLIAGIVVLDAGASGVHITNQSSVYALRPEARSRLNSAYMTAYFVGGALGSESAALAYGASGWLAVCLLGALLAGANIVAWFLTSRRVLLSR